MIPSKRNRKIFIPHDTEVYKQRNRIERCFGRLKHFRRFATRYDRNHPLRRLHSPRRRHELVTLNVDPA